MWTVNGGDLKYNLFQVPKGPKILPELPAVPFGFRLAFKVQCYNNTLIFKQAFPYITSFDSHNNLWIMEDCSYVSFMDDI